VSPYWFKAVDEDLISKENNTLVKIHSP